VSCERWGAQPINPGVESVLYGVDSIGRCSAYVVGYYVDGAGTRWSLLEHWDGSDWVIEPGATIERGTLYDVLITSSTTGWAVGSVAVPDSPAVNRLILRWNGSSWKRMNAGPATDSGELRALSTVGKNGVWAVGRDTNPDASDDALALRWNGSSWGERTINLGQSGTFGTQQLYDVQAMGASSALAVGVNANSPLFLRWNGKEWKKMNNILSPKIPISFTHLNSIRGTDTDDAWAVGWYVASSGGTITTLVAHWNGKSWKIYDSPGGVLTAVNPGCCRMWAVGYHDVSDDGVVHHRTLVLSWDSRHKQWVTQNTLNISPSNNQLFSIDGSATNAWAVGSFDQGPAQPLALPCC
jgi:hypothetical protein